MNIKSTPCVQWVILLYFWCCGPIFLLEFLDILFRRMASPTDKKNQKVTDSYNEKKKENLIMCHVQIFQPYTNPNTNLKMCHWAQNQASAMAIPVLWTKPCRNEWGELKRRSNNMELWIWRIWSDSGWRNGLWSRVRCSLTSSGIIGENLELWNRQMEVSKVLNKRVPLIVSNVYLRIYFIS